MCRCSPKAIGSRVKRYVAQFSLVTVPSASRVDAQELAPLAAGHVAVDVVGDLLEARRRSAARRPACRCAPAARPAPPRTRRAGPRRTTGRAAAAARRGPRCPGCHGASSTGSCSTTWSASSIANASGAGEAVEFISTMPPVPDSRWVKTPVMWPGMPPVWPTQVRPLGERIRKKPRPIAPFQLVGVEQHLRLAHLLDACRPESSEPGSATNADHIARSWAVLARPPHGAIALRSSTGSGRGTSSYGAT